MTQGIRDSADVEMSLMVRASRNLPIMLLTNEYKRILERRLQVVGGECIPCIQDHLRCPANPSDE